VEGGAIALVEGERGGDAVLLHLERHVGAQDGPARGGGEDRADSLDDPHLVGGPAVVERGVAGQLEGGPAAHREALPDQQVTRPAGGPRLGHHEVDDLADGFLPLEPGQQDVGVGQVQLLGPGVAGAAGEGEIAALAGVEQRAEERGGVEPRRAVPVDRAVSADERDRPQVADDAVLLDREVALGRPDPRLVHISIIAISITGVFHQRWSGM